MRAYVDRDSVAYGDDMESHAQNIVLPRVANVRELVAALVAAYPLPMISGGKATWVVSSGIPLAVIAQQWREPQLVCSGATKLAELDIHADEIGVHFSYLVQRPPEQAVEVLRSVRLRAYRPSSR